MFPKHTFKLVTHNTKIEHINYPLFSLSKNKATHGRYDVWYTIQVSSLFIRGKEQMFQVFYELKHIHVFCRSLTKNTEANKTDYMQKSYMQICISHPERVLFYSLLSYCSGCLIFARLNIASTTTDPTSWTDHRHSHSLYVTY